MVRKGLAAVVFSALLTVGPAYADEPSVVVQDDGTVLCHVTVEATEAEVRAFLADPVRAAQLSPDVIDVAAASDGSCHSMTTKSKGLFRPLVLRSRRCPTDQGWREVLVEAGDFTKFDGQWEISTVDSGTQVVYRLTTGTTLPVPDKVVHQGVARSLKNMLKNLTDRVR